MKFLDSNDMLWKLRYVPDGSLIFVSYKAGRPPSERAVREAQRHTKDSPRRYYTGRLESVWQASNGDWILTMEVFNRDTLQPDGTLKEGAYRSFNPNLGELILVQALDRDSDSSVD